MPKLLVTFTGMPGSGKSTIANGLKEKGYNVINMGDAIRAECKRQNLEPTSQNLGKIMLELRTKDGNAAVAKLITPQILESNSNVILVDGIRSNDEIKTLTKICPVKILSVHASTDTRFTFLTRRGRTDDPTNRDNFEQRDSRELGIGISESIALADETISNNNLTIPQLVMSAEKIIKSWL